MRDAAFRRSSGSTTGKNSCSTRIRASRAQPDLPARPFFVGPESGALGLTEYNAETPAGAAYNDDLAAAFMDCAGRCASSAALRGHCRSRRARA